MQQTQIYDLTLDICILITGSGISDDNTNKLFGNACFDLMNRMITGEKYHLVIDDREKIRTQYFTNLKPDKYGHYFVRQMATMGKVDIIPWKDINKGIQVKLGKKGFTRNNEDYKFVVVSSRTCCKKLVSHEPHFFNIQNVLNKIGVTVTWPHNA